MSAVRTIAKNILSLAGMMLAVKLLAFAIFVLIVRRLSNEAYGTYAVLLAYCSLCTLFCDLGITTLYAREYARRPELIQQTLFDLLVLRLASAALVIALATVGAWLLHREAEVLRTYFWLIGSFVLVALYNVFRTPFDSQQRMEHNALIETVHQTLILVFSYVALKRGGRMESLGAAHFASSSVCLAIWIADYRIVYRGMSLAVHAGAWVRVMLRSLPFLTFSLLSVVQSQMALLLLGILADDAAAGFFSKAFRIVFVIYTVPQVVIASMYPVLSRLAVEPSQRFAFVYEKLTKHLAALGAPAFVGCWLLADPIIRLVCGPGEQANVVWCFRLLAMTLPLVFLIAPGNVMLNSTDRERLCLGLTAVGACALLLAGLALVPVWHEYGACAATVFSSAVLWVLFAYYDWKLAGVRVFNGAMMRVALSSAAMGLALVFLRQRVGLGVSLAAGASVYALALAGSGFFDRSDLSVIRGIAKRST